jgi:uncharacterized membrane protein
VRIIKPDKNINTKQMQKESTLSKGKTKNIMMMMMMMMMIIIIIITQFNRFLLTCILNNRR